MKKEPFSWDGQQQRQQHKCQRPQFIDTYERFDFNDAGELPAYLAQELAAAAYYREGEEDSNSLHQDSYVLYDPNPPFLEGEAWQRHVAERYGTSIDIPLHQVASILGESFGFDERILENLVEQEQESSSLPSFKVPVMGVTHEINQRMYSKSHFQHWVAENFPQHSPPTTPMLLNGSGNVIEAESFEDIVALEDKLRTLVAKGEIPVPFILKPVEGSGGNLHAKHRSTFESQKLYPVVTQEVLDFSQEEDDGAYRKSLMHWLRYFREKYKDANEAATATLGGGSGYSSCLIEGYVEGSEESAYYFVVSRSRGVVWDLTKTYAVENGVKIEESGVYGKASPDLRAQFEALLMKIGMHGTGKRKNRRRRSNFFAWL
jgi:hypothetical protein